MDFNEFLRIQQKYGTAPKPETPKSIAQNASQIASSGKSFLTEMFAPTKTQQEFESQVLPQYSTNQNPVVRAITAPGTAIARGGLKTISRLTPLLQESTKNITERQVMRTPEMQSIKQQIDTGALPKEILSDFDTLEKNKKQMTGEALGGLLEIFTPGLGGKILTRGISSPIKQGIVRGGVEGAAVGNLYGWAQVMADDDYSWEAVSRKVGVSTVMMGAFGAILGGVVPVSRTVQQDIQNFLRVKGMSDTEIRRLQNIMDSKKLEVQSAAAPSDIPVGTPRTRQADYGQRMGYEPITPQSELPTIEFRSGVPRTTGELPVIQADAPTLRAVAPPGMRYEPIAETAAEIVSSGRQAPSLLRQVARPDADDVRFETPRVETAPTRPNAITETIAKQEATPQATKPIEKVIEPTQAVADADAVAKRINARGNEFTPQVNKEQIAKIQKKDLEEVKDIAFGRAKTKDEVPPEAHLAYLKNIADDMAQKGDTSLALELQYSNIGSRAGQNLQSLNIAKQGNIVDTLRDVRLAMEQNLPSSVRKRKDIEIRNIEKQIKEAVDSIDLAKIKPTAKMIEEVIKKITC